MTKNPKNFKEGRPTRERIGQLTHVVVGELLQAGHRAPTAEQLLLAVGAHPEVRANTGKLGGARQQVVCGASVYFRFFAPPATWRLTGREVRLAGCRLDLRWEDGDGHIVFDEIKTGRLDGRMAQEAAEKQAEQERRAALAEYGERFTGLRVVVLGGPSQSFTLAPDGARAAITWEMAA
jgi:hypothetical protein